MARGSFASLNSSCCTVQFLPGFGRTVKSVFAMQIRAVIEDSGFNVAWHGNDSAAQGAAFHDDGQMLLGFIAEVGIQINQILGKDGWPYDINEIDVRCTRFAGDEL